MATECRAKNPATCRMHGNPTISNLQAQADQAAVSGNAEEYLALRQQIDAAHDKSDLYHDNLVRAGELQEKIVESGAEACFDSAMNHQRDWSSQSLRTRDFFRKHVENALAAAEPHMVDGAETSNAVKAIQHSLNEGMSGTVIGSSYRFNERSWVMAHAILKETLSLRQQLKAAKRNVSEAL